MFLSGCRVYLAVYTQHSEAHLRLWVSLLPSKIITPVVGIEQCKGKGERNPGDDVDFLCLEMEIFVPGNQGVRLPSGAVTVDDWSRRWGRIVGTVATLNNNG